MNHDDGWKGELKGGRRVAQRREDLLRELRPVVERRRRRRAVLLAAKGAAAVALVAAALVGGMHAFGGSSPAMPEFVHAPVEAALQVPVKVAKAPAMPTGSPRLRIEMVETRVGISRAVQVVGQGSVGNASDDDLITALYETGQEPELVRVGGRVVIAGNLGRS